jgi:hypothetical protein
MPLTSLSASPAGETKMESQIAGAGDVAGHPTDPTPDAESVNLDEYFDPSYGTILPTPSDSLVPPDIWPWMESLDSLLWPNPGPFDADVGFEDVAGSPVIPVTSSADISLMR